MHSADLVRLFHSTIMENIQDIASKIVDNDMLDGWSQLRDYPLEISGRHWQQIYRFGYPILCKRYVVEGCL